MSTCKKRVIRDIETDLMNSPIPNKKRKIDENAKDLENVEKLKICLIHIAKCWKCSESELTEFYQELCHILPSIIDQEEKENTINAHYRYINQDELYIFGPILNRLFHFIEHTKNKNILNSINNIIIILLKHGLHPMYNELAQPFYNNCYCKQFISISKNINDMILNYKKIWKLPSKTDINILQILAKHSYHEQAPIITINYYHQSIHIFADAVDLEILDNINLKRLKELISMNVFPTFGIIHKKVKDDHLSIPVTYDDNDYVYNANQQIFIKCIKEWINNKGSSVDEIRCVILVFLIWKYYVRNVKKIMLNTYDNNMILSRDIFEFMICNYCVENINYLKNIHYTKWINFCLKNIYKTNNFQQLFYEEMIKENKNENDEILLAQYIVNNMNIMDIARKIGKGTYYPLMTSLLAIYLKNTPLKPSISDMLFVIFKAVKIRNYNIFKLIIQSFTDKQLKSIEVWSNIFNSIKITLRAYVSNISYKDIFYQYMVQYFDEELFQNQRHSKIIQILATIKSLNNEYDDILNQIFIHSALKQRENIFMTLIQNNHIENIQDTLEILEDILLEEKYREKRDIIEDWIYQRIP